jgi:hypothetical protein
MSETHPWQQLGGKRTTAGGGADSEAGRASHLDADPLQRWHTSRQVGNFCAPPAGQRFPDRPVFRPLSCLGIPSGIAYGWRNQVGGNRLAGHPEALGLPPDESGTALALTSWLHPEPMPACRS